MRIISFAWTTPALLAGHKTVTRRDWEDDYGKRFKAGEEVLAYNRSQRHHGEPIAHIRILSVEKERNDQAPDTDFAAEGFEWFAAHPEFLPKSQRNVYVDMISRDDWERFCASSGSMWVIRFEVLELTGHGYVALARLGIQSDLKQARVPA